MKKIKRYAIAVVLLLSLICLTVGVVACKSNPQITALRIENARIDFMQGDEFETGEDFTVIAVYDDGTEKDVTAEVSVRQESGMDMDVAGNYQITVSYGEKREIYTVYVNGIERVLSKIDLDHSAVKKNYNLGESVSLDGLVLYLTYENLHGDPVKTTSLKDLTVEIKGEDGTVVEDILPALGKYTVTVSQGNVKASFELTADKIDVSTVGSAITVGSLNKGKVLSGDTVIREEIATNGLHESFHYQYEYGNNYTRFSDVRIEPVNTYHCSMDEDGIFIIRQEGDKIVTNDLHHPDMMNGSPYYLWYYKDTVFGIEDTLVQLYKHAKQCTNQDLVETVNEATGEYSFSFSGLERRSNNYDYYETVVSFTLSEDFTIATAEFRQDYYEDNSAWKEELDERTFITDPVTGITTPQSERPSHYVIVTMSQTTGERTAENEFPRNLFDISSFDLTYEGQVLEDGATLECDVATGTYVIGIENILPVTALFTQDDLTFDYEGNRNGSASMQNNEHFTVFRSGSAIQLTVRHGGSWTLIFQTKNVTKRLTINVTGVAPAEITAYILNDASGSFYQGETKTIALGGAVYFYGAVEAFANADQKAELISGNASASILERAKIDGIDCFKFSASVTGVYEIRITSTASPSQSCAFTFTVSDAPDYSALLSGTYTAEDAAGNVYRLTFNRADEGATVKGTISVTRTPTEPDGTPIPDEAVTETLSFYVEQLEIFVDHKGTDKIWLELSVNEENQLILIDQRMLRYPLVRESE